MAHSNTPGHPHLAAVPAIEDLEVLGWIRVTEALRDYAAAVEFLERVNRSSTEHIASGTGASPAGGTGRQGPLTIATAACTRARRRCEDALLLLDAVSGEESVPATYDAWFSFTDAESSAAS